MAQRRCFRFAYNTPVHEYRPKRPFQMRDGEVTISIMTALVQLGYKYGGAIFNVSSRKRNLIPFDTSSLRPSDLILLITRPPVEDIDFG